MSLNPSALVCDVQDVESSGALEPREGTVNRSCWQPPCRGLERCQSQALLGGGQGQDERQLHTEKFPHRNEQILEQDLQPSTLFLTLALACPGTSAESMPKPFHRDKYLPGNKTQGWD